MKKLSIPELLEVLLLLSVKRELTRQQESVIRRWCWAGLVIGLALIGLSYFLYSNLS